jgi:hypothetical protein
MPRGPAAILADRYFALRKKLLKNIREAALGISLS